MTGPYGHTGVFATLEDIVRHHVNVEDSLRRFDYSTVSAAGGPIDVARAREHTGLALDKLLASRAAFDPYVVQKLDLSDADIDNLVNFMKTLTDPCLKDSACLAQWIAERERSRPGWPSAVRQGRERPRTDSGFLPLEDHAGPRLTIPRGAADIRGKNRAMLSRAPETDPARRSIVLLIGWLFLIASLLYDPFTPGLTAAENLSSPFRLGGSPILVQGKPLECGPLSDGRPHLLDNDRSPVLPLFLMLFGHETWRRICPLSFVSQIPRMLGWQRKVNTLNRAAGSVDRILALLPGNSWIRRNHYYFQFGFLSFGVLGRILFYNSDRMALFICVLGCHRLRVHHRPFLRWQDMVQLLLPDRPSFRRLCRPRRVVRLESAYRAVPGRPVDVSSSSCRRRPQHLRRLHHQLPRHRS